MKRDCRICISLFLVVGSSHEGVNLKKLMYVAAAAATLLIGTLSTASAAPVYYCSNGGIDLAADGCISGDSKAYPGGGDGLYDNAGGGDDEASVEAAILAATGIFVDISLYGKSDDNAGLFSISGSTSGTWDVLDDLINIAYITVKAANSFALYDVGFVNSGSFSTLGILSNGGQQPGYSHISFWTAPESLTSVPVPAAGWLLIAGMGGFAAMKRRKKA